MSSMKWPGTINFQPVTIWTDHQALHHWVIEHVETPSGPRRRRARLNQVLSQYNLTIQYVPAANNQLAEEILRWAYPANGGRVDVSVHGSLQASLEVMEMKAAGPMSRVQNAEGKTDPEALCLSCPEHG